MNEKSWLFNFLSRLHPSLQSNPHLLSNFFFLGLIKATDALILLFLIPIIISRVGIANFGIIAFAQVLLNYGKTIVDYGFNISGVRSIALKNKEEKGLSDTFFHILYTRIFIGLLFVLVLCALGVFFEEKAQAIIWGSILVIGHIFFLDWFFVGIQKTSYLAAANLMAKIGYAISIIVLIQAPDSYIFILPLQGITSFVVNVCLIAFVWNKYDLQWIRPNSRVIYNYLYSDFKLLSTNLAIEFNTTYSILILGLLTTNAITGYFNVIYKIVQPIRFLLVIFSQAIFPIICERTKEGWKSVEFFLRKTFSLFWMIPMACCLLLFFFAQPILMLFTETTENDLVLHFRFYLLVPLVVLFNIPAYQILLAYERKSAYTQVYMVSLFLNMGLGYFFTLYFGLWGTILSIVLVESFTTLGLYIMLWRERKYIPIGSYN